MRKRPDVQARRDRAFAQLLIELDRIVQIVDRPFHEDRPAVRPGLAEGDRLVASVVSALRASAGVLTGGGAQPDIHAIVAAPPDHRTALARYAAVDILMIHAYEHDMQ